MSFYLELTKYLLYSNQAAVFYFILLHYFISYMFSIISGEVNPFL